MRISKLSWFNSCLLLSKFELLKQIMFNFFKKDPKVSQDTSANPDRPAPSKPSLFTRLKSSLSRTRTQLASKLANLVLGKKEIDAELLLQLEKILL